jgi:hypothetical protein
MASIEASTDRFSQLYSLEVFIMAIGFCLIVGQCGLLKVLDWLTFDIAIHWLCNYLPTWQPRRGSLISGSFSTSQHDTE